MSKWSQDLVEVVDIDDRFIRFKQAPFIFEYINMLSEKRAKSKTTVEKNLYKLLANSTYGKFVETGLKCKPQPAPPVTRSKSRKEPNALREAARSHRPITRSQKKGVRKRS